MVLYLYQGLLQKHPSPFANTLAKLAPNEQEHVEELDKAFRDIGRSVGLGDIWNEKDEETGKTYYEIQEPETTAGKILKTFFGEYITALAVTRNPTTLFTKLHKKYQKK